MKKIIGIDIGATKIAGGIVEGPEVVNDFSLDTQAHIGETTTLSVLKDVIRHLITEDTSAIGVGVPSVVDSKRGIVYHVQNIKNWEEVDLKSFLETEFNLPVFINNDANCFAKGERIYGLGKQFQNFVGITLGTGVGGGIIQKGEFLSDANCGSGEFGELPYLDGKLENYCGSFFFLNQGSTGYDIALKAKQDNKDAIEIMNRYGKHIAELVKIIVLTFDPEAIIFGGSISRSMELFKDSMYEGLENFAFPLSIRKLKILKSELQNSAILGAAALCY